MAENENKESINALNFTEKVENVKVALEAGFAVFVQFLSVA